MTNEKIALVENCTSSFYLMSLIMPLASVHTRYWSSRAV
eukprot:CAMPEP_0115456558 /NCGR_PEP_ID=MMETSP0271-20121206/44751_1 /TAXON_ID=71861 /ORGANISM="Scrippsiella trochoidea, Strain CCMP3099" /LENGTH=38 /DNA_ID= /DNA_START= /DNA_END= /DNA_ORIENTATION=